MVTTHWLLETQSKQPILLDTIEQLIPQCTSMRQTLFQTTKSEYESLQLPELLDESVSELKNWLRQCFAITRHGNLRFRLSYRWPFSDKHWHIPDASMNASTTAQNYLLLVVANDVTFNLQKRRFTRHGRWKVDGTITEYRIDYERFKSLMNCKKITDYLLTD